MNIQYANYYINKIIQVSIFLLEYKKYIKRKIFMRQNQHIFSF